MKVVNKNLLQSGKDMVWIKREKYLLKELKNNPFIVDLKYTFQDQTHLFFIMELLVGGDIGKRIRMKLGLSDFEVTFYISEVIVALKLIHKENFIYRDLKPENVLINENGHIKLVDFGFAKRLNEICKDKTYTIWGTPGYMSPEVLVGAGHSYKTDIWWLGIFIWEILGGFTPFHDQNPMKINKKIINNQYTLPKNLSVRMKNLIKLILVSDPVARLELDEIQSHPVFEKTNWKHVENLSVTPPYIPKDTKDESYYFTKYNEANVEIDDKTDRKGNKFLGDFHLERINKEFKGF
jgi:protein kinase A